jgi:ABC-type phosphate transport system substrate-binding protein
MTLNFPFSRSNALAACFAAALVATNPAAAALDPALPAYRAEHPVTGVISSVGDARMETLMTAWMAQFRRLQPGIRQGTPWNHASDATAFGALMFETADLAPLARAPLPTELAPYAHQFAGDMMKSPLLVRVAGTAASPAYIAVNKRPGAPLPAKVSEFLGFVLSSAGQQLVAQQGQYAPLDAATAGAERAKLDGYLAELDPGLPAYRPAGQVRGTIASVGSDGMKTLMDRWMRSFRTLEPGVRKGERWEHLGTLNGFHALIAKETDLAPMGRELWPAELAAYASAGGGAAPLEIRVARGGFNTPQRTTAQAIFVHASNPLGAISLPQLQAIMGPTPVITRWGQLGLQGEWAARPITLYMPLAAAPNSMSMQLSVLRGGTWNRAARAGTIADTAAAIAADPGAIGFGGLEEGGPGLKALAVAASAGGVPYQADYPNASSGRYPLTRYMYIRLNRRPGQPLAPPVREFLRYILSREGQEPILYSGYFPLTAEEVRQELDKLR